MIVSYMQADSFYLNVFQNAISRNPFVSNVNSMTTLKKKKRQQGYCDECTVLILWKIHEQIYASISSAGTSHYINAC